MHENEACLNCPECGGPMTPGERRDNGRCQYCEDASVGMPVIDATKGHLKVRLHMALQELHQGLARLRRAMHGPDA